MMRTVRTIAKRTIRAHKGLCLMSVMGLLGLMGCSSDQNDELAEEPMAPVFNQTTPITFSSSLADNTAVTRSQGLETSTTSFKVWAYKNDAYDEGTSSYTSYQTVMPGFIANYGPNTAYTTTTNTNDWEYVGQAADQTIKYWDWGAKAYRFFAVADPNSVCTATAPNGVYEANGANAATVTASVDGTTTEGINAAPYFSELWFSTGNAVLYADKQFGKPVTLKFVKPFARVRFVFTFVEGLSFGREALTHVVFKPTNDGTIATAGNVTVTYPLKNTETAATWSTANTTGITQFDIDYYEADDDYTPTGTDASAATTYDNTPLKWYTVLPASDQGTYTVSVQVNGLAAKTAVVPAEYMNWKAGYEYTYKFKITEGGGVALDVVLVAINNWVEKKDIEHEVYNW